MQLARVVVVKWKMEFSRVEILIQAESIFSLLAVFLAVIPFPAHQAKLKLALRVFYIIRACCFYKTAFLKANSRGIGHGHGVSALQPRLFVVARLSPVLVLVLSNPTTSWWFSKGNRKRRNFSCRKGRATIWKDIKNLDQAPSVEAIIKYKYPNWHQLKKKLIWSWSKWKLASKRQSGGQFLTRYEGLSRILINMVKMEASAILPCMSVALSLMSRRTGRVFEARPVNVTTTHEREL